jgi:hypothetical protein
MWARARFRKTRLVSQSPHRQLGENKVPGNPNIYMFVSTPVGSARQAGAVVDDATLVPANHR